MALRPIEKGFLDGFITMTALPLAAGIIAGCLSHPHCGIMLLLLSLFGALTGIFYVLTLADLGQACSCLGYLICETASCVGLWSLVYLCLGQNIEAAMGASLILAFVVAKNFDGGMLLGPLEMYRECARMRLSIAKWLFSCPCHIARGATKGLRFVWHRFIVEQLLSCGGTESGKTSLAHIQLRHDAEAAFILLTAFVTILASFTLPDAFLVACTKATIMEVCCLVTWRLAHSAHGQNNKTKEACGGKE